MGPLKEFKDFLSLPYFCAKLVGVDPTTDRTNFRFNINIICLAAGVINHLYLMVGELVYINRHFAELSNLLEATKMIAYITYGINTNTKVFAVLSYQKRLRTLLKTTEGLYPKTTEEKLKHRVNENFWPGYTYMLVGMYLVAGWTVYCMPGIKFIYDLFVSAEDLAYETPFWVAHPFNYRSKVRYFFAYFSELWGGHLCVCSNVGVDLVLCCLSKQMSMHFKYIGREIEGYNPTGRTDDCVFLAELIQRHQLILELCLELNEIFGVSLVFNFLSSSGIICLSAFQVTLEGPGIEFSKFFLLLISALGQLFIVCDVGNELIISSSDISESVYSHPWYNGNKSYKKMLIILILRSQKPAKIIAKGFSTVSLVTFKEVTSLSYRTFALLHTLYSED